MTADAALDIRDRLRTAIAVHQQGRLAEAEQLYRDLLRRAPEQSDALHFLGVIETQRGHNDAGLALMDRAIAANPRNVAALYNRANLLRDLGRHKDAVAGYDAALAIRPGNAPALNNRGTALQMLGRYEDAASSYERALAVNPNYADAHSNRGNVLALLGRFADALASYDRALASGAAGPELDNNRACMLMRLNRNDEACIALERAIAESPGYVDAFNNRALAAMQLRRFEQALGDFTRALELKPELPEALYGRASALIELNRHDEAIADFNRLLKLQPDYPYALGMLVHAQKTACDWRDAAAETAMLDAVRAGKRAVTPLVLLAVSDSSQDKRRAAEIVIADKFPAPATRLWRGERYGHSRIRIAYLSADFRTHPVAMLMAGVFEHHDRARFETVGVSYGPDDASPIRARLMRGFGRFVDAREKSDAAIASLIREMEADILVDLTGFTASTRPAILALRPAPVQVNYLGFAGTLGADYADYIIADRIVIPEEQQRFYTEKAVYLPDCYMAQDATRIIGEPIPSRTQAGLPETGFVFASFNNSYKFAAPVFDIWMRLLQTIDDSVLWLPASNPAAMRNLKREAEVRGVSPARIVFAAHLPDAPAHLARLKLADLFLDTLPYNAHSTAADALWAGLPLLTCAGESFASRVAASLLHAAGLPELVTHTLSEYEQTALSLARDPAALNRIRSRLAKNRDTSPLFDTARFTRNLEAAYTIMWQRAESGEPPASFTAAASTHA